MVFDDTCCFLPCGSEQEATHIHSLLSSRPAQEFITSMIFWDNKRPITIDLLSKLDLRAVAAELMEMEVYDTFDRPGTISRQLQLFE